MGNHFLQNYKIWVFPIKFVAKSVLYKIFCKKIDSNFLQILFHNKICKYNKIFKTKLIGNINFCGSVSFLGSFKSIKLKVTFCHNREMKY